MYNFIFVILISIFGIIYDLKVYKCEDYFETDYARNNTEVPMRLKKNIKVTNDSIV